MPRHASMSALEPWSERGGKPGEGAGNRPDSPVVSTRTCTSAAAELAPAVMAAEGKLASHERDDLQAQLCDLLANDGDRLRSSVGPQNDVARAVVYLIAASHQVCFGCGARPRGASRGPEAAVRAELCAIPGALIDVRGVGLKQNPEKAPEEQQRSLARESFVGLFSLPPDRVTITSRGYRIGCSAIRSQPDNQTLSRARSRIMA